MFVKSISMLEKREEEMAPESEPENPGASSSSDTDSLCDFGLSLNFSGPQFPCLGSEEVGLDIV